MANIVIGHLFRGAANAPFELRNSDFIYNKLLIIETLFTEELYKKMTRALKAMDYTEYIRAKNELQKNGSELNQMKQYYSEILKNNNIDTFLKINEKYLALISENNITNVRFPICKPTKI